MLTLNEALQAKLPLLYATVLETERAFEENPTEGNRQALITTWRRYHSVERVLKGDLV